MDETWYLYVDADGYFMGGYDVDDHPDIEDTWVLIDEQPPHGKARLVNGVWDMSEPYRINRDYLLETEVDPIVTNPLRWAELTTEQQDAWKAYRQALLDITEQAGFPHEVVWPTKP
jgi:hypothetical protein